MVRTTTLGIAGQSIIYGRDGDGEAGWDATEKRMRGIRREKVPLFMHMGISDDCRRLEETGRLEEKDDHMGGTADSLLRQVDNEVGLAQGGQSRVSSRTH